MLLLLLTIIAVTGAINRKILNNIVTFLLFRVNKEVHFAKTFLKEELCWKKKSFEKTKQ